MATAFSTNKNFQILYKVSQSHEDCRAQCSNLNEMGPRHVGHFNPQISASEKSHIILADHSKTLLIPEKGSPTK